MTQNPPFEARSDSREALIEAGKRLFSDKSYDAVSTRELAEVAGVNLGAIQYHFGSKAKLFVASICRLMEEGHEMRSHRADPSEIESRERAAHALCDFIFYFLRGILLPEGPQACRVMFREIFTNWADDKEVFEALISAVVNDFIAPDNQYLLNVLQKLCPQLDPEQRRRIIESVIGQCSFHVTHRPFATRLNGYDVCDPGRLLTTAIHISSFTLRGIGCAEDFVAAVVSGCVARWRALPVE